MFEAKQKLTRHKLHVKGQVFHPSLGGHEGDPGGPEGAAGQAVLPEEAWYR